MSDHDKRIVGFGTPRSKEDPLTAWLSSAVNKEMQRRREEQERRLVAAICLTDLDRLHRLRNIHQGDVLTVGCATDLGVEWELREREEREHGE